MAICYHRKQAWISPSGLVFKEPSTPSERVLLPCGRCIACRINKASEWANRVIHESSYVDDGCFITLTYAPESCPSDYSLRKKDFQNFLKRLRIWISRHDEGCIRAFLGCGEYGDKRGRPHYHLLLLGWSPKDLVFHHTSYSGMPVYTSAIVERLWARGFAPVGTLTSRSAGYVARYAKKAVGDIVSSRSQPFVLASRNIPLSNGCQGAIGAQWLIDNHAQLSCGHLHHPCDPVVNIAIPDYYLKLLERWYPNEVDACRDAMRKFALSESCNVEIYDECGRATPHVLPDATLDDIADFVGQSVDQLRGLSVDDLETLLVVRTRQLEDEQIARLNKLRRNLHEK